MNTATITAEAPVPPPKDYRPQFAGLCASLLSEHRSHGATPHAGTNAGMGAAGGSPGGAFPDQHQHQPLHQHGGGSSADSSPAASPAPARANDKKLYRRRQSVEMVARRWRISFEESLSLCANFEHQQGQGEPLQAPEPLSPGRARRASMSRSNW